MDLVRLGSASSSQFLGRHAKCHNPGVMSGTLLSHGTRKSDHLKAKPGPVDPRLDTVIDVLKRKLSLDSRPNDWRPSRSWLHLDGHALGAPKHLLAWPLIILIAVALGSSGPAALRLSESTERQRLGLAVALIPVVTIVSGITFAYGVKEFRELPEPGSHPLAKVPMPLFLMYLGTVFSPIVPPAIKTPPSLLANVLLNVPVIGALPAAASILALKRIARELSDASTAGKRFSVLVKLRSTLNRLAASLGWLLALTTLSVGAALRYACSGNAVCGREIAPRVLFFGGWVSGLIALLYVPAANRVNRASFVFCDEHYSLESVDEDEQLPVLAERRQRILTLMGAEGDIWSQLQENLVLAGPLLASAISLVVSK
jgi:hypothetical protein